MRSRLGDLYQQYKLELAGFLLIAAGLFTILALLSPSQGVFSSAWLDLLSRVFGWGRYVVPLGLLAAGLAMAMHSFGDRLPLPEAERILGGGLLYVALLVVFHLLLGATDFAQGVEIAGRGQGGGLIGASILALLLGALGLAGTLVVLGAWLLIGVALTAGLTVAELVLAAVRALDSGRVRLMRALRPTARSPAPTATPGEHRPSAAGQPAPSATPASVAAPTSPPLEGAPASIWDLPQTADVLEPGDEHHADEAFDGERARLIEETLRAFGAPAHIVEINRGPTITQFGVEPDFLESRGGRRIKVKVSKISSLSDDLALALAAPSIRIEAPVPSKGYVGIEVPNAVVSMVALRDVMEAEGFQSVESRLRIGLGRDVSGRPVAADLAAMPHLLIAGTTGSGKSVCINAVIACLLMQNTPDDLKFVMVDPKRVELTFYNGVPHLLAPVVVDLERVVPALQWISREMNERYRRFAKEGVRNIADFNQGQRELGQRPLPYLVVVIDELADLMMLAPDQTERALTRLAQLARATGIHLVIATQRPSVDVVTGLIKANFPARIAFAVAASVDSRVILDQPGAEKLLGRGDMLYQAPDASAPVRLQGVFVSEPELGRLIRYWKNAALDDEAVRPAASPMATIPSGVPLKQTPLWEEDEVSDEDKDELFDEAVNVVREMRRASISLLQRRLRIGYTRAARLVDQLEAEGIVGPEPGGSQAREVLDYGSLAPTMDGS